jgi:hypothetical protein
MSNMDVKEPETWDAAVKMCQATLQKFVPEHERVNYHPTS